MQASHHDEDYCDVNELWTSRLPPSATGDVLTTGGMHPTLGECVVTQRRSGAEWFEGVDPAITLHSAKRFVKPVLSV